MTGNWRKRQEEDRKKESIVATAANQNGKEEKDFTITTSLRRSSSSSESCLDENETKQDDEEKEMMSKCVTEADLNALGAKRLKAELMGNEVGLFVSDTVRTRKSTSSSGLLARGFFNAV